MPNIDLPTAESLASRLAENRDWTATRAADIAGLLETFETGIVVPVTGSNASGWVYIQDSNGYLDARNAAEQLRGAIEGSALTEGAPVTPNKEQAAILRTSSDVYAFDLNSADGKLAGRVAIYITLEDAGSVDLARYDRVSGVPLTMTVELGRTNLTIGEVLEMRAGQVIVLDSASGEPSSLYANGKLIARGNITVVDQQFAIQITEILDTGMGR